MTYSVVYQDRRGAGCTRYFGNQADLVAFVSKIRIEAQVFRIDGAHVDLIGEVARAEGQDDLRVKWHLGIEVEA